MPESPGIYVGPQHNILQDGPQHAYKVHVPGPALTYGQFRQVTEQFVTHTITGVYREADQSIRGALDQVRHEVDVAIQQGAQIIVVSNRGAQRGRTVPIPSLLLVATAHQTLLDRDARAQISLLIEAGDAVEPTHVMRLLEAGAEATFPFHGLQLAGEVGAVEYVQRLNAGAYQLLLEAGISDYSAYLGSRRFHIVGLEEKFVEEVFSGAPRALGTFGVDDIGHQLTRPAVFLKPVHELLSPIVSKSTSNRVVEAATLEQFFLPPDVLTLTDSRQNVDLVNLAHAEEVVLEPPAHHDTTRPDGLRLLIKEIKAINPHTRVHVRIGTDLTCEDAASEAVNAGADVVNLVDGEYEWVLGLLALSDSPVMQRATIAVGTGLRSARDVFVAAALGARKYRLDPQVDLHSLLEELGDLLARVGVSSLTEVFG
ncbi:MAG TPA: glutamate synthase central domain-containing protein, partial [Beutenbergiaceae bacterium]|nr:glutamate synthase central domain-containing protein [Beutenbergiaceae bacterium]